MHFIAMALLLVPMNVIAATAVDQFDPAQFEQRFHKADKGKKGKLSRAEAYAEFPRMPEFFDEIDTNRDRFITLEEVRQAMERRVNAAIDASNPAKRYGSIDVGKGATGGSTAAEQGPQFASSAEARRYHRNAYYESLAGDKARSRDRGEPVSDLPSSPVLNKPF